MTSEVLLGIMIPFIGTSLGAGMVFFLKNQISENVQKILTGFAAGVMVAASFWSLLQPALESSEGLGKLSFAPAAVGFLVGIGFLLLLDEVTPHMHMDNQDEGPKNNLKRTTKLILAVTLHNIPEGMAVGVVYAGWLAGGTGVSQAAALALALGIAIQNFPEGAINFSVRCVVRRSGADRFFDHDPCGKCGCAGAAIFSGVRGRRHDVRRRGGTDSGNVRRKALELGDSRIRSWIRADDGMGAMADHFGADKEHWEAVGYLHDYDYEKYPEEHLAHTEEPLRAEGVPEEDIRAILSHGYSICTDVEPVSDMEKSLFTVDELSGIVQAAARMRPNGIVDMSLKSFMKKWKDKRFAAGCNREIILKGCGMLGMDIRDVAEICIRGMQEHAEELGLAG